MTSITFFHGLGDSSNAAHLFSLHTRRGHRIAVQCTDDKACLFEAAGCELVSSAASAHPWEHAPAAGPPGHSDHWSGNKTAWNVSRPPLPDIGGYAELWDELCSTKLESRQVRHVADRLGS